MRRWLLRRRHWIDERLPIMRAWRTHMAEYYAPKNFNIWYFFGVLSMLVLVNQLLTGIWLTMSYNPSAEGAFQSVEYIMRDVDYGWILRYMHSTGASAFFIVIYLHMFRALIYGSYHKPRELVWILGMFIFLVLMAEAFVGYVLPWGQMSYWGAQVIISLFGAIPVVGDNIVEWVRGDYLISGITLNRFFALHVVALPFILIALVILHILALHEVGSNNPDGVEIKKHKDERGIPKDGIPFQPYYTVHDLKAIVVFLFVFCAIMFFAPEMGGYFLEHANFEAANSLKTPDHIAPVWYFTPFYSVLRAIPDKLWGFVAFAASVAILFVLPWLDRSPIKSVRYRGLVTKIMIVVFAAAFLILGVLGVKAPTFGRTLLAQITTVFYFAFFVTMPIWSRREGISTTIRYLVFWMVGGLMLYLAFADLARGSAMLVRAYAIVNALLFFVIPVLLGRELATDEKQKRVPERVTMRGGLGFWGTTGAFILIAVLTLLPLQAAGAEGAFDCGAIACDKITTDVSDQASLQRGAKYYMNYCMGCHSLQYARYERTADDLGIPLALFESNLKFDTSATMVDLMQNALTEQDGKHWFGVAPLDLTLAARVRGADWLYTYLRTFYVDTSRPWGVNNKVFPEVGMPHVLLELQGRQVCAPGVVYAANKGVKRHPLTDEDLLFAPDGRVLNPCGRLHIMQPGQMTPQEYDTAVYDLVNFLAYIAEPMQEKRRQIGVYVLLFIALFFIFAALLNREYWKDIHH